MTSGSSPGPGGATRTSKCERPPSVMVWGGHPGLPAHGHLFTLRHRRPALQLGAKRPRSGRHFGDAAPSAHGTADGTGRSHPPPHLVVPMVIGRVEWPDGTQCFLFRNPDRGRDGKGVPLAGGFGSTPNGRLRARRRARARSCWPSSHHFGRKPLSARAQTTPRRFVVGVPSGSQITAATIAWWATRLRISRRERGARWRGRRCALGWRRRGG